VIEAMALGTPVVTSDGSSLTEVAGDAALLVDPYSVDSIAWAIRAIEADADLRGELVERGRLQAKKFSPGAYDERLRQLYEKF
jgi:glycosyltransferase involved in cell wall biosynthesis